MLCAGKTGKEVRYASISLPRRGRRPWHAQKLLITRCGRLSTQATRLSGRRGRGVFLALQLHLWTVRETRHFGVGTVLGRRVYLAVMLMLVTPPQGSSACKRSGQLGVPMRTLLRWRRWWREDFLCTAFWCRR